MDKVKAAMRVQVAAEELIRKEKASIPEEYSVAIMRVLDGFTSNDGYFEEVANSISPMSPHPLRNMATGLVPITALLMSLDFAKAVSYTAGVTLDLAKADIPMSKIVTKLAANVDSVRSLIESSGDAGIGVENTGALMNVLGPHRFLLLGRPMFLVDQKLCEGLIHTEFGMSTPAIYLRSPMPYCYIEFGTERNLDVFIYNDLSGNHQIEGVYIADAKYDERIEYPLVNYMVKKGLVNPESPALRFVELEFTGSPIGKDNSLDDATFNISLLIDDDSETTIEELYLAHVDYYKQQSKGGQPYRAKDLDEQSAEHLKPALELLIKCLIFINSDLSTRQKILERPPLLKQLGGLKNPAKRRKLLRKLDAAKDYILISSKAPLEYRHPGNDNGGSKSAHWRRGHFRNQRHGEGNSLVKIKWIQPTLVGVGAAQIKTYKVTE